MSLVQAGMGRVIVSGHLQSDEALVRRAFALVANTTQTWGKGRSPVPWTEMDFCPSANATTGDKDTQFNIPVASLKQLRHVFLNRTEESITGCWLGSNDRWKYVFLGEPDLLLVTKPEALPALGRALREGRVLAPHRFQPLPHASDFRGIPGMDNDGGGGKGAWIQARILPNAPPFQEVEEIDEFDSCCDQGSYKPFKLHEECSTPFWWMCGYINMRNPKSIITIEGLSKVVVAHKRLLGYPLMRLKRGTGVVYASAEGGKFCRPTSGSCTKWRKIDNSTESR